jgi:hypothetical protein
MRVVSVPTAHMTLRVMVIGSKLAALLQVRTGTSLRGQYGDVK